MKVLIAHSFYRAENPSGENRSVEEQVEGLRRRGHDVELLAVRSTDMKRAAMQGALSAVGLSRWLSALRQRIECFQPDVVHLENVTPFLSPRAHGVVAASGVPLVASIRSFRLSCLAGTHYRDGKECYACSRRNPSPGVFYGCYQGSRIRSIPLAVGAVLYSDEYRHVDIHLVASNYMKEYLIANGIRPDRVVVRPNSVPDCVTTITQIPKSLCYLGRLDTDKGVDLLIRAWEVLDTKDWRLTIAGNGSLAREVAAFADRYANVVYAGPIHPDQTPILVSQSSAVVVPSQWPEPFGRVAVEAFVQSRPAIATSVGGLGEIVDRNVGVPVLKGLDGLVSGIRQFMRFSEEECRRLGSNARARYEKLYTPDANLDRLESVYHSVTDRTKTT